MAQALRGDVVTGIAVTLIGVVYYIATFWIQETNNIVTPRTFPAIVGIALIALGLFLAGQALYRGRKAAEVASGASMNGAAVSNPGGEETASAGNASEGSSSAGNASGGAASAGNASVRSASAEGSASDGTSGVVLEAPQDPPSKKVVIQFALFFVYLAILIPVGFLLSTAAFLMTVTSIYAPHRWIRNLIFSVLFALVIYVAFVYGLAVYLPVGILG